MKIILLSYQDKPNVSHALKNILPVLKKYAHVEMADLTGNTCPSPYDADIAVVLGGDGSILRAVHQMGTHQLPVLAVNHGRLGFLADVDIENIPVIMPQMVTWFNGMRSESESDGTEMSFHIFQNILLECSVLRSGTLKAHTYALNEVAILNGAIFTILEVRLYADEELVTTYSCDGLILSTPIGSTAHSLSAGGPIIRHGLDAIIINPICPHTLTHRPVVDSADRIYRIEVEHPNRDTSVVVDGTIISDLISGDVIEVRRSTLTFQRIIVPGHSYFRTLREKLGWSGHTLTRK